MPITDPTSFLHVAGLFEPRAEFACDGRFGVDEPILAATSG